MNAEFTVKAIRLDGSLKPVYLADEYSGEGETVHEWAWGSSWSATRFYDLGDAKAKMRTNAVRTLRSYKEADGTPLYRIRIVRIDDDTDEENPVEISVGVLETGGLSQFHLHPLELLSRGPSLPDTVVAGVSQLL